MGIVREEKFRGGEKNGSVESYEFIHADYPQDLISNEAVKALSCAGSGDYPHIPMINTA